MKKRVYKRGMAAEGLMTIGGVVLAVAVILIAYHIILSLTNSFASLEDQVSVNAYNNIVSQASRMLLKNNEPYTSRRLDIQLSADYTFAGFNKNQSFAIDACPPYENAEKPAACGAHACICMYKPGYYEDFENNKIKQCTPLPGIDYIFTLNYAGWYYNNPYRDYGVGSTVYKNIAGGRTDFSMPAGYPDDYYSYFFMYGQCDGWSWDQNFGRQAIYMEKTIDGGKTYLFIAAYTPGLEEQRQLKKKSQEEHLASLIIYCGNRTYADWWVEVTYSADSLASTEGLGQDIKDCINEANAKEKEFDEMMRKDIEGELAKNPQPKLKNNNLHPEYYSDIKE